MIMRPYITLIGALTVMMLANFSCSSKATGNVAVTGVEKPSQGGDNKKSNSVQPAADARLTHYEYRWTGMMWPPEHYILDAANDGKSAVLMISSMRGGLVDRVEVGAEALDGVAQLIDDYKLLDLSEGYSLPSEFEVLDGYHWSLSIGYSDKTRKLSSGRNCGPDESGFRAIGQYLDSIASKAGAKLNNYNDIFKDY